MPTRCNRWYLLQILFYAQHVSGNTMLIIRSWRVLYRWSLPVVFGVLVFRLSVWCGAEGYVSGLQAAACPSSGAGEYYTDGRCLWYLVLWFSGCRYDVELKVMCPVCRLLLYSMFTSFLYMFRATMCPSSGEITVSMRHLVFVTLCGWLWGMHPACRTQTRPHRLTNTKCRIDTVFLLMMGT